MTTCSCGADISHKGPRARKCDACIKESHRLRQLRKTRLDTETLNPPPPEHYVAKERSCLRCGKGFDSAFAGDRICGPCRTGQEEAERKGHWHLDDTPFDPVGTPALLFDDLWVVA